MRVEAIGLNFADIFTGLGLYGPIASGEVAQLQRTRMGIAWSTFAERQ